MRSVEKSKAIHYRVRAESFFNGMSLLADDMKAYSHAVALLAVHASISLADALLIACTGQRSDDQDHRGVLKALERLCKSRRLAGDREGIKHLGWLLSMKTDFAYGDDSLALVRQVPKARLNAERFFAWVYGGSFRELAREEKAHDER